jgi:hypothetical protein
MVAKKPPNESADRREMEAAFVAAGNDIELNGRSINWRLWAGLPDWSAGEAARLMRGLDPDIFENLSERPKKTVLADVEHATSIAKQIQKLAERNGKQSDTPAGWLAWARENKIAVMNATAREIERMPRRMALTDTKPSQDELQRGSKPPAAGAPSAKARVAWRKALFENIEAIDELHGGRAKVMDVISWLKKNGKPNVLEKGSSDVIVWLDDLRTQQTASKKAVSNAIAEARRFKAQGR